MSDPERIYEQASELIRRVSTDVRRRRKRRRRQRQRAFRKVVRTAALMALAGFVIVVGMTSAGFLFGPRGIEGLIAAPLALLVTWAAILYWSLKGGVKTSPAAIVKADLAQLPAQTEEWLEQQRRTLPSAAQSQLDALALRLEVLAPQLRALDPQTPAAAEVRRLLGEELPELVRGYQRVPQALQSQPLHGGPSPDRRLLEGLATIEEEVGRMHARLAADDLHALATQQRYLEIKYKDDKLK